MEAKAKKYSKTTFVVQSHKYSKKPLLVYSTSVTIYHEKKPVVRLAPMLWFSLFSVNVTNAFLQSAEKLMTDVIITPAN